MIWVYLGSIMFYTTCFWFCFVCDFISWIQGMCFRFAIWALQVSLVMQLLGALVKGSGSSFGFLSRDFDHSGFLMAACCRATIFTRWLFWLVPWTHKILVVEASVIVCVRLLPRLASTRRWNYGSGRRETDWGLSCWCLWAKIRVDSFWLIMYMPD